MKRFWAFMALFFAAALTSACNTGLDVSEIDIPDGYIKDRSSGMYAERERLCMEFVENRLTSNTGGIHTNYIDSPGGGDVATGHEMLCESEGLIMIYYANRADKEMFDRHYAFVANRLLMSSGTLRWRVDGDGRPLENTSASIDDLRVVRAMLYAYDMWGDEKYMLAADKIGTGILKNTTYKGSLVNHYDEDSNYRGHEIDLSYIDLLTMSIMEGFGDKGWKAAAGKGIEIIDGGYLGDDFPFYRKAYDLKEESYDENESVNMIDSLLVVLHLGELGMQREISLDWLKNTLEDGPVYSRYKTDGTAEPGSYESTAVYAIIARIAKNAGDYGLHRMAVERMISLQVKYEGSRIYGAFGDESTLEVFSFDNLQALLGF
ncbi:hypothetical protein SAMN02745945_02634 [Peptoclostridium litorale DSM 5388]|uniref:Glycoside hydrolase family 8 n=1 Tax=Peptoclostridium litorale DSM 5388 TaxID=1121324 RepID=A0A069REM8_PEPLI|nr:hypothetical protein [Peptoclostridium litorale]KDR94630.1 glycoside hydrolase family 8 [Peptoclostridium litorale DSM 5388]SIO30588.1 hypothetical protein SAMN02745945_02634 [Peptoclostridium litorale DSM 5388]